MTVEYVAVEEDNENNEEGISVSPPTIGRIGVSFDGSGLRDLLDEIEETVETEPDDVTVGEDDTTPLEDSETEEDSKIRLEDGTSTEYDCAVADDVVLFAGSIDDDPLIDDADDCIAEDKAIDENGTTFEDGATEEDGTTKDDVAFEDGTIIADGTTSEDETAEDGATLEDAILEDGTTDDDGTTTEDETTADDDPVVLLTASMEDDEPNKDEVSVE